MKGEMGRGAYPREASFYMEISMIKSTIFGEGRQIDWGGKEAANGIRSEAGIGAFHWQADKR